MTYQLVSTSNFTRGFRKLSGTDNLRAQKRIIEELVTNPYSYKELAGKFKAIHSARFGDHRVIYSINETTKEVILLAVESRSSAYKR